MYKCDDDDDRVGGNIARKITIITVIHEVYTIDSLDVFKSKTNQGKTNIL